MIKEIPIEAWARSKWSKQFAKNTLYGWARGEVIKPKPRKVGGCWMVKENAEYVAPDKTKLADNIDPVVAGILN
ncbi:MAG: hypothetical protein COB61_004175 [Thiotrichales bacterium]|nr:hypothetical protein [Thiotrichales bacterium]